MARKKETTIGRPQKYEFTNYNHFCPPLPLFNHGKTMGLPDGVSYSKELETARTQNKIINAVAAQPCSRMAIAQQTGVHQTVVNKYIRLLIADGVLTVDQFGIVSIAPLEEECT